MQKVIEDYIRMCYDGFLQGWHERNGGNLTYRMRPEESEECASLFTHDRHVVLPVDASPLAGEYFITTAQYSGVLRGVQNRQASFQAIC